MKTGDILVKEFPDMMNVYCYNFHDPSPVGHSSEQVGCVKHIFTGPWDALKKEATSLFYQIQDGVELTWQGLSTGIAEGVSTNLVSVHSFIQITHAVSGIPNSGPYYSWSSPRHGWVDDEIPKCIDRARKLISRFVNHYGEKDPREDLDLSEAPWDELLGDPIPSTSPRSAREGGDKAVEMILVNHVVTLGWTTSGSRKVKRRP